MRRAATALVVSVVLLAGVVTAQQKRQQDIDLQAAIRTETVDGDLNGAIKQYGAIASKYKADRTVAATALIHMAECYQKLGDVQARKIYEQVVREYAEQKEAVARARTHLADSSGSSRQSGQTAHQIWTGAPTNGSVSVDGRYVSFTDWTTGDVAIRDLATNSNRQLTHEGTVALSSGFSEDSVISPDSRQVAFNWWSYAAGRYELRVAAIAAEEGSRPRTVYWSDQTEYVWPQAWTPDGNQLLILRELKDGTSQLAMLPLKDSAQGDNAVRVLKSLGWWSPTVSLSPDGRTIAYDAPDGGIALLAVDGRTESTLGSKDTEDSSPQWTPDGSHIVFLSRRSGATSLWTVRVEGARAAGPPELLKTNVGSMSPMGIVKSGILYYSSSEVRRNISVAELDATGKVTKPVALASERFLNSNGRGAWSRDGRYLAYYSFRGAQSRPTSKATLVIRTISTGKEQDISLDFPVYEHSFAAPPKWFPDGQSVLVVGDDRPRQPGVGYYRVDLSSGKAEMLLHTKKGGTAVIEPELSPDGKTIFYLHTDDGPEKLMRFDIDSRSETELHQADMVSIAASPDGTQLAYLSKDSIQIMPAAGGEPRTVYRVPGVTFGQSTVTWMPDQKDLLFVQSSGMGAQDTHVLWRVPLDGSAPEQMGLSRTGGYSFEVQVHPDGRRIAFESREASDTEIWALENFLPASTASK